MTTTPSSPTPRTARNLADAVAAGPVVLDGGLATELERAGHDVTGALWSAGLLRDRPDAVVAAHRRFFEAGAEVATTASYQASFEGLAAAGVDAAGTRALLRRSVELARAAAGGRPGRWVAASVGPYGAMLTGGQEYTGAYADPRDAAALDIASLAAWHRPRLEVLADAGADVLACETVPAAAEARALIEELARLDVPGWLSLTAVTRPDGRVTTRLGEPVEPIFALAGQLPQLVAVGVNCTDPDGADRAVAAAARASGKPVVVYPNSGESWDAGRRVWSGSPGFAPEAVTGWLVAGARLVGGCCRVGPTEIAAVAAATAR
ncbi:MAG TPA: homocysteine S-methyltransferase [Kineosporiaceae bacterium]